MHRRLPRGQALSDAAVGRGFSAAILGDEVTAEPVVQPAPPVSSYGYVLRWSDYYAPRALYRLLDADIRATGLGICKCRGQGE